MSAEKPLTQGVWAGYLASEVVAKARESIAAARGGRYFMAGGRLAYEKSEGGGFEWSSLRVSELELTGLRPAPVVQPAPPPEPAPAPVEARTAANAKDRDDARAQVATLTQERDSARRERDEAKISAHAAVVEEWGEDIHRAAKFERLYRERFADSVQLRAQLAASEATAEQHRNDAHTAGDVIADLSCQLADTINERDAAMKDAEALRAERNALRAELAATNALHASATCSDCGKYPGVECRRHFVADLTECDATIRDLAATATTYGRRVCLLLDVLRAAREAHRLLGIATNVDVFPNGVDRIAASIADMDLLRALSQYDRASRSGEVAK